jgi:hypothetical protein
LNFVPFEVEDVDKFSVIIGLTELMGMTMVVLRFKTLPSGVSLKAIGAYLLRGSNFCDDRSSETKNLPIHSDREVLIKYKIPYSFINSALATM